MQLPLVFQFNDYKDFIKARIEATPDNWGLISKLAEACGCQRSYFSKVLSENVHFIPDHVYGLCEFWQLPEAEETYFLTLLELARAGSLKYRLKLEKKLKSLKAEQENLKKRLNRTSLTESTDEKLIYYSSWQYSAIHILVSIPEFQKAQEIAKRLELPLPLVQQALQQLKKFGLIEQDKDRWKVKSADFHLGKNSLLIGLHHNNWRQRAVLDSQDTLSENIHYTVIQSMSRNSFNKLKQKMLQLIDDFAKEAGPSKEEELYCFALDFFDV